MTVGSRAEAVANEQVEVEFHLPDGNTLTYEGTSGESVMDVALDNNVPGIIAQCGGGCTCCTCHVWLELPRLPPAHQDERDMLEYAWGMNENSRLACQIKITPEIQRIVVSVPEEQA